MSAIAGILEPLTSSIDAKLGRCASCMRLSATLTAASWALLTAQALSGVAWLQPLALAAVVLCTSVSLAHAVAYLVREPAGACTPCARKAQRQRRAARIRRIKSTMMFWRQPRRRASGKPRECIACKQASRETLQTAPEELPNADAGLLDVLRTSSEFQSIAADLADSAPIDTWQGDLRNFFVFQLHPDANGHHRHAVFVIRWEDRGLLSAAVITADPSSNEPQVRDLRQAA